MAHIVFIKKDKSSSLKKKKRQWLKAWGIGLQEIKINWENHILDY